MVSYNFVTKCIIASWKTTKVDYMYTNLTYCNSFHYLL
jgi:hypothetical protein